MSAFYIGQRVKKVRGNSIGVTATVVTLAYNAITQSDMQVRVDQSAVATNVIFHYQITRPAGTVGWAQSHQWELIIPDGLESLEEINALYEPQGVTA